MAHCCELPIFKHGLVFVFIQFGVSTTNQYNISGPMLWHLLFVGRLQNSGSHSLYGTFARHRFASLPFSSVGSTCAHLKHKQTPRSTDKLPRIGRFCPPGRDWMSGAVSSLERKDITNGTSLRPWFDSIAAFENKRDDVVAESA